MTTFQTPIIPPITDPLGGGWEQPKLSEIHLSLKFAWMGTKAFLRLKTYQHSTPTGIYTGKMWKFQNRRGYWMLAYITDSDLPDMCNINCIRIGLEP